jgi:hypothetical protein
MHKKAALEVAARGFGACISSRCAADGSRIAPQKSSLVAFDAPWNRVIRQASSAGSNQIPSRESFYPLQNYTSRYEFAPLSVCASRLTCSKLESRHQHSKASLRISRAMQ